MATVIRFGYLVHQEETRWACHAEHSGVQRTPGATTRPAL